MTETGVLGFPDQSEERRPPTQAAERISKVINCAAPENSVMRWLGPHKKGTLAREHVVYGSADDLVTIATGYRARRLPYPFERPMHRLKPVETAGWGLGQIKGGVRESEVYSSPADVQTILDRIGERNEALLLHGIIAHGEANRNLPAINSRKVEEVISSCSSQTIIGREEDQMGIVFFAHTPEGRMRDAKMIQVVTDKTIDELSGSGREAIVSQVRNLVNNPDVERALSEIPFHAVTIQQVTDYSGEYVKVTDPRGEERRVYKPEATPEDSRASQISAFAREFIETDSRFQDIRDVRRLKRIDASRICFAINELQQAVAQRFLGLTSEQELTLPLIDQESVESYDRFLAKCKKKRLSVVAVERHGDQDTKEKSKKVQLRRQHNRGDGAKTISLIGAIGNGLVELWAAEKNRMKVKLASTPNPRGEKVGRVQAAVEDSVLDTWEVLRCIDYAEGDIDEFLNDDETVDFNERTIDGATGIPGTFRAIIENMGRIVNGVSGGKFGRNTILTMITHTQQIDAVAGFYNRQVGRLPSLGRFVAAGSPDDPKNQIIWERNSFFGDLTRLVSSGSSRMQV